jgi:hypothetical protein
LLHRYSFAATLNETIDLDQPTVEFIRIISTRTQHPTLALAYYNCFSIDPRAEIFNDMLGLDIDTSPIWDHISNLIGDPIGKNCTLPTDIQGS